MRVVDTSPWIECLKGSDLGRLLANELPAPTEGLVPTIVQLERVKWALRESGAEKAEEIVAFTSTDYTVILLDTAIAAFAAELAARHKLATAGAIIYATAQIYGAERVTLSLSPPPNPAIYRAAPHPRIS